MRFATIALALLLSASALAEVNPPLRPPRPGDTRAIRLAWDIVDTSRPIVAFRIYRGTEPGVYTHVTDIPADAPIYQFSPTEDGVYHFEVTAILEDQLESLPTNPIAVTVRSPTAVLGNARGQVITIYID